MAQTQHVAGDGVPRRSMGSRFPFHVLHHLLFHRFTAGVGRRRAIKRRIPLAQPPRVVVRLAPQHDAIDLLQLLLHLRRGGEAAIDRDGQMRKVALELVRHGITQRRHFAVFFRAEALEPGVAGMHDEGAATGITHRANKIADKVITLVFVDTNAVLHRDRHVHHIHHGFDAIGHQHRLIHQAGAKSAALHPLARATTVQVDFVVTPLRTQAGAVGQVGGFTPAQLQSQGMLFGIELQMARHIAMQQGAGSHHLGVQQRVFG